MIVITEKNYQVFKKYKIEEIKAWQIVQIMKIKVQEKFSYSVHIKVLRKDPTWTWKIIWEWVFENTWNEYLFHSDFIYRNYSLNPLEFQKQKQKP